MLVRQVHDVRAHPASWQVWTFSLLLACMPLCFAMSSRIKTLPMAALFVIGVVALGSRDESRRSYRMAWSVAAVCLLRLAYDLGNFLGHRLDISTLDLPMQTLLFLGIAAVVSLPLKQRVIAIGFSLTTIVLGAASLFQRYVQGADRPYGLNGGDWAAVEFAMYLLVLVLLSMLQSLRAGTSRGDRWLHVVAVVIGLYGAVLTQSRGPLLAFAPVYLGLMLWYATRSRQWRRMLTLFAVTVAGMLAITTTLHREMVDRLSDVSHEIATYGPNDTTGAVRERLAMWHTAWDAFAEHPLTGIGLDQFGVYARAQVAAGKASPAIATYVHPHSEYLESLAAGGLPALLVLLLFFAVPTWFFARHLNHANEPVAAAAIAGLMVIGMYALCAFSDNVFYRAMPQSLYLFLVLGLAVSIGRQLHDVSTH
ncbi:O-antigen ligase family protein [Rhodanobacter umsongensis]|uniref:O-antigen ligase family protein n=1 Tax=Rhodanobacter umsongensis TaxID=633153 RepID=A0ABW0JKA0_9GAMM